MTSIDEQIKEVERELHQRSRVYARLVQDAKMSPQQAEYRTRVMTDVLITLQRLRNEARPGLPL